MDMDKCIGLMELITKGTGIKEFNMGKGNFISQMSVIRKECSRIIFWLKYKFSLRDIPVQGPYMKVGL